MNKTVRRIYNSLFFCSIISFIYTLGFFGNFTSLLGIEDVYYNYTQAVNTTMFNLATFGLVVGAIIVATKVVRAKKVKLWGYLLLGAYAVANALSALTYVQQLPVLRSAYRKLDFDAIMRINKNYQISERIFTLGTVVMVLHMLIALGVVYICIKAFLQQRKQRMA